MSLSIRHVKYFVATAELGRVSQAAINLNISQSAVTTAIKELESTVGSVLFARTHAGMELTDAGRRFLGHAYSILAAVDEALNLPDAQSVVAGSVRDDDAAVDRRGIDVDEAGVAGEAGEVAPVAAFQHHRAVHHRILYLHEGAVVPVVDHETAAQGHVHEQHAVVPGSVGDDDAAVDGARVDLDDAGVTGLADEVAP